MLLGRSSLAMCTACVGAAVLWCWGRGIGLVQGYPVALKMCATQCPGAGVVQDLHLDLIWVFNASLSTIGCDVYLAQHLPASVGHGCWREYFWPGVGGQL